MTQLDEVDPPRTLRMAGGAIRHIEALIARTSPVGDSHFFDPALFPWTSALEAAHPDIVRELATLTANLDEVPGFEVISTDQEKLTNDGRWKTYFFRGYGVDFPDNCQACPRTWSALRKIPRMTTAFFSILEPMKRIPPHRGPYKGVLRYHLGLVVPRAAENAWLDVGGERRHWRAGGSLVFDDSFVHSAGNDTDQIRVVLFVDFVRPLPFPVSLLNELVIGLISRSPYVREAKQNYDDWRARRREGARRSS
ncbi:MAG TPA: aspartyl/asparaginyl beta-hydroxylase domain-containing protein [Brevundimonas sp.]|nr:aspartyl/asparaginyl beta-hydroxylase domain-containing protein [Brevundimonas sp.]